MADIKPLRNGIWSRGQEISNCGNWTSNPDGRCGTREDLHILSPAHKDAISKTIQSEVRLNIICLDN